MRPLLIVKTANGFAVMPYSGEIPPADLSSLTVALSLRSSYSYGKDGLLGLVEEHFTLTSNPAHEPAPVSTREIASRMSTGTPVVCAAYDAARSHSVAGLAAPCTIADCNKSIVANPVSHRHSV